MCRACAGSVGVGLRDNLAADFAAAIRCRVNVNAAARHWLMRKNPTAPSMGTVAVRFGVVNTSTQLASDKLVFFCTTNGPLPPVQVSVSLPASTLLPLIVIAPPDGAPIVKSLAATTWTGLLSTSCPLFWLSHTIAAVSPR